MISKKGTSLLEQPNNEGPFHEPVLFICSSSFFFVFIQPDKQR